MDMNDVKSDTGMKLLQQIGIMLQCNVLITRDGKVRFVPIDGSQSTTHNLSLGQITELTKYDTNEYLVTYVVGKVSDEQDSLTYVAGTVGASYNTINVVCPYINQATVTNILGGLTGIKFHGHKMKVFNIPVSMNVLDFVEFTQKYCYKY